MSAIDQIKAAAEQAEADGKYREAADLYSQLGTEIQATHGRFDTRALDAFEGVARVISKGAEADGAK